MLRTAIAILVAVISTSCGNKETPPAAIKKDAAKKPVKTEEVPLPEFDEPPSMAPAPPSGPSIELVLHSTPEGATVAVDGLTIGATPTVWRGRSDGKAKEFTFFLPRHVPSTYKFVPIRDGVVHGQLVPGTPKKKKPATKPAPPPSP